MAEGLGISNIRPPSGHLNKTSPGLVFLDLYRIMLSLKRFLVWELFYGLVTILTGCCVNQKK